VTDATKCMWLEHFHEHVPPGPQLIILDGHITNVNIMFLEKARTFGYEVLTLTAHSTIVDQVLDRTPNLLMKREWTKAEQILSMVRNYERLDEKDTAAILNTVIDGAGRTLKTVCFSGSSVIDAFAFTGTYPLDLERVRKNQPLQPLPPKEKTHTSILDASIRAIMHQVDQPGSAVKYLKCVPMTLFDTTLYSFWKYSPAKFPPARRRQHRYKEFRFQCTAYARLLV
jgi:hypothetical protein